MGDENFKWYLASDEDAEIYDGKFDTKEDALSSAPDFYESGQSFVLIEADKSVVRSNFNVDRIVEIILEDLEENNPECWGEDGVDDGWNNIPELKNAIKKTVAGWLKSNPPKTFCVDTWRTVEHYPIAA